MQILPSFDSRTENETYKLLRQTFTRQSYVVHYWGVRESQKHKFMSSKHPKQDANDHLAKFLRV
jgi:hypothetical protein